MSHLILDKFGREKSSLFNTPERHISACRSGAGKKTVFFRRTSGQALNSHIFLYGSRLPPYADQQTQYVRLAFSGRAPNLRPAKMPASWPPCNAPRKTSTNCWRTSIGAFTNCASVASTRRYLTSSPDLRRWAKNETPRSRV